MSGAESGSAVPDRRLVLVVGVGRSGTSLCAGILGSLGFRVPQPEVRSDETNPRGFGEPRWVVDFHTRLLRGARVTVFDSRPLAWEETGTAGSDEAVQQELLAWLRVQFVGSHAVVVKDPRTGWFLPLWMRAARELGIGVSTVTMLRHPAEVVSSARKAYGTWQSEASRATAWLNVMLGIEHQTRAGDRVFIRYDRLLADWRSELSRASQVLDLELSGDMNPGSSPHIDALVDPSLHRSKVGWADVPVPDLARTRIDQGWDQLSALAEPGGDDDRSHQALDASREDYVRFYQEVEAIAQSSVTAAKPRKKPPAVESPPATVDGLPSANRQGRIGSMAQWCVRLASSPLYRERLRFRVVRLVRRVTARASQSVRR